MTTYLQRLRGKVGDIDRKRWNNAIQRKNYSLWFAASKRNGYSYYRIRASTRNQSWVSKGMYVLQVNFFNAFKQFPYSQTAVYKAARLKLPLHHLPVHICTISPLTSSIPTVTYLFSSVKLAKFRLKSQELHHFFKNNYAMYRGICYLLKINPSLA